MKIYFQSTKNNNEDRKCVEFVEGMNTTKIETEFGNFTMQNESISLPAFNFDQSQGQIILKKLNANLRKGFGRFYTR